MRTMLVPEFGPPDVFRLVEAPDPEPGPEQVVIAVEFAGVNFTDIRNRRGDGLGVPPFVPGVEVAGRIAAVGDNVEAFSIGDPVVSVTGGHGYASAVAVASHRVYPLPGSLVGAPVSGALAAALPSALKLLARGGRVRPGEVMLIHGASGGVGTALVQVAEAWGLGPVHGTVGSQDKAEYAARYPFAGIHLRDEFVESVGRATGGRGVDVVFDPIGGAVRASSFEILAPFGRLIHFGNASHEPEVVPDAVSLRARALGYVGYSGAQDHLLFPDENNTLQREAIDLVADGKVQVDVTEVFPLEEAARAHALIEDRRAVGKLVLAV